MSLQAYTARMGYRGAYWLDITRGGNEKRPGLGITFAPSASVFAIARV